MFLKNIFLKRDWPHAFKNQLSWALVPLLFILWYVVPTTRAIFAPFMVAIVVIGTIETIFYERKLSTFSRIISVFLHLILLMPFIPFNRIFGKGTNNDRPLKKQSIIKSGNQQEEKKSKRVQFNIQDYKYFNNNNNNNNNNFWNLTRFNLYSFAILIVANIVIFMLPYWPYYMCRNTMSIYLNLTVILLWLYNFIM